MILRSARTPQDPRDGRPLTLDRAARYVPWVADRVGGVRLTDARATLRDAAADATPRAPHHRGGGG